MASHTTHAPTKLAKHAYSERAHPHLDVPGVADPRVDALGQECSLTVPFELRYAGEDPRREVSTAPHGDPGADDAEADSQEHQGAMGSEVGSDEPIPSQRQRGDTGDRECAEDRQRATRTDASPDIDERMHDQSPHHGGWQPTHDQDGKDVSGRIHRRRLLHRGGPETSCACRDLE